MKMTRFSAFLTGAILVCAVDDLAAGKYGWFAFGAALLSIDAVRLIAECVATRRAARRMERVA